MSMLDVPFVNFPSIVSSLTASSSRPSPSISIRARSRCQSPSAPARWSGLGRKADPAPDTGYEPKLADFFSFSDPECTPIDNPDNHHNFLCSDDLTVIPRFLYPDNLTLVPTSPEGLPRSAAPANTAASRVPSMFGFS